MRILALHAFEWGAVRSDSARESLSSIASSFPARPHDLLKRRNLHVNLRRIRRGLWARCRFALRGGEGGHHGVRGMEGDPCAFDGSRAAAPVGAVRAVGVAGVVGSVDAVDALGAADAACERAMAGAVEPAEF